MSRLQKLALALIYSLIYDSAQAETSIDTLKVDDIVTDTALQFSGGLLKKAPLPLPKGEWKVIGREDSVKAFQGWKKTNFVDLYFMNLDRKSPIAYVKIYVNTELNSVGLSTDCITSVRDAVINNFNHTRSQLYQLCGIAYPTNIKPPSDYWEKYYPPIGKNPERLTDTSISVELKAYQSNGRMPKYEFIINAPATNPSFTENPLRESVEKWIQENGDLLRRFVSDGESVELTAFPSLPKINGFKDQPLVDGRFVGDFVDDLRHGNGTMSYKNGNSYSGSYKYDRPHGTGQYIVKLAPSGVSTGKYSGQFIDGYASRGTFTYDNGDVFEGVFDAKNDPKRASCQDQFPLTGKGTITYKNGDIYTGQIRCGLKNGKGKIVFANGESYEGGFEGNLYDSEGTMTYSNGSTYVGRWLYGMRHGQGMLTNTNPIDKKSGVWNYDTLTDGKSN